MQAANAHMQEQVKRRSAEGSAGAGNQLRTPFRDTESTVAPDIKKTHFSVADTGGTFSSSMYADEVG
jgi:hypothetical protein